MLSKILKKNKNSKKRLDSSESAGQRSEKSYLHGSDGFKAKKTSTTGAYRQRSIGNRNNKPSR